MTDGVVFTLSAVITVSLCVVGAFARNSIANEGLTRVQVFWHGLANAAFVFLLVHTWGIHPTVFWSSLPGHGWFLAEVMLCALFIRARTPPLVLARGPEIEPADEAEEIARLAIHRNWNQYYGARWRKYAAGNLGFDWNFPAFFIPVYWFMYRRFAFLWLADFFLVGSVLLIVELWVGRNQLLWFLAFVLVRGAVAMTANRLYFRSIRRTIHKIQSSDMSPYDAEKYVTQRHQTMRDKPRLY